MIQLQTNKRDKNKQQGTKERLEKLFLNDSEELQQTIFLKRDEKSFTGRMETKEFLKRKMFLHKKGTSRKEE
ncbi:MAG: hypothetical protein MR332_06000 [Fusicatenibacter sp.]|nr:hypothetical protein [Fusicatenibacter sp.]